MKGIVLAGGKGTRLYPLTMSVSKQLLPVYDKPMIYYPLSMLFLAGIQEILIISTPEDLPNYQRLLGNGDKWGVSFSYKEQSQPRGFAEAFLLGKDFIGNDTVSLILGDNIFFATGLSNTLQKAALLKNGAVVFAYPVKDPHRYGVVEFDQDYHVLSLEEKPENPRSNYAVPGIYFYDQQVIDFAENLQPSGRGELEITDINKKYLERGQLMVEVLGRGVAWLDAGTHESLLQASEFVQAVQERQGLMIACLEEIAFRMNFIDENQLEKLAYDMAQSQYGQYLISFLKEKNRFPQTG
jgi:glucose-1-phosphate thymidylyltransferase